MAASRDLSGPIALRIPSDILRDIERIAEMSERTRSWVIVRALKSYLAAEGGEILAAREGREQIKSGRSHVMDDVLDKLDGSHSKSAA